MFFRQPPYGELWRKLDNRRYSAPCSKPPMKSLAEPQYRSDIISRLNTVRPGATRQWGRMTPHQMICHLSDSFRAVMGERDISSATGVMKRTVVKWVALHTPLPWPHGFKTRPEADQELGGTKPVDFDLDMAGLLTIIERFSQSRTRSPHPMFGDLSEWEWQRWGYLHLDHHLRQFGA